MYRYSPQDHRFVAERVQEFRQQVQRRLAGDLSEDDFRPLRLMNGLYLQRHAYMLRVCIPYGNITSAQVRTFGHIAETYDRGYGHWTTRQNIQFNWLRLEDVPDILQALADVELHAIQTSGNCVRNVTSDPLAGVASDEEVDPRPWCEAIRQYFTLHPEFMYLPRKFKIAVTGAPEDRAASFIHDIALRAKLGANGDVVFRVAVGGGQGRTPRIAKVIHEDLPAEHLLSYLEAILRVYNLHGRRDNKYKARIKILVGDMGAQGFREAVDAEWELIRDTTKTDLEAVASYAEMFDVATYADDAAEFTGHTERRATDVDFDRWLQWNVKPTKRDGYHAVTVSCKEPGRPPGDLVTEQFYALADVMDAYSQGYGCVTFNQNVVLPHVSSEDLGPLFDALRGLGLAVSNVDTLADLICCPGLDYCNLANAASIPVAQQIMEAFDDLDHLHALGRIHVNMSGCINACGHHHTGHIGILGINKRGEDYYQIALGGSSGGADDAPAKVGTILGQAVPRGEVVDTLETILETYVAKREDGEIFYDTVQRLGIEPFREAVYA